MRRITPIVGLLATLFAVTAAQAVPLAFTHQARLLDGAGDPLVGPHSVRFSLYETASGGSAVWTEQASVDFDNGLMSHVLGSVTPMLAEDFDTNSLFLGIAVDGSPELAPRVPLTSAPFAIRALNARNVSGGVVDASEIRINGSVVLDSSGALQTQVSFDDLLDVPADLEDGDDDTLAGLGCGSEQVAIFVGGNWTCADTNDHTHNADDLVAGTLSIDRIPVGSTSGTVAAGDHVHSFSAITGELGLGRTNGNLDVARISGDLPLSQTSGNLDASRISGNLPLSQTSGNLDISRTTGDIPSNRLADNLEAIANLSCSDGESPRRTSSGWECAAPSGGGGGTLLGNWEFDESNGTSFVDTSGLGNTLTAPTGGQAAGSGGHSGNAVNFSGGVLVAASSNTIPDSPYVSVEAWVRPTSVTGNQTILHKTGSYKLTQEAGKFVFEITSQHTVGGVSTCKVTHSVSASASTWAQARGFYNGREIGVAINDQLVSAACALGPIKRTLGGGFFVGAESTSRAQPYDGRIDEVRLLSTAPQDRLGYNVSGGSLPTCNSANEGALVYRNGIFLGCTGDAWTLLGGEPSASTRYNFTTCGQTGQNGPSQAQCNTAYSSGTLNGRVTVVSGIQEWTVPTTGTYRIEAWGAGGSSAGNSHTATRGARIRADVALNQGEVLRVLVGQMGSGNSTHGNENGGGGGSFIVKKSGNVPVLVAGGGGGAPSISYSTNCGKVLGDGSLTESGGTVNCNGSGLGGTGGAGGRTNGGSNIGAAGGGFNSNGQNGNPHCSTPIGGSAFVNGGQGGSGNSCYSPAPNGGFGGGGAGGLGAPGGGGGYSGGGAAGSWSSYADYGGGGGSYMTGTNRYTTRADTVDHGRVEISFLF